MRDPTQRFSGRVENYVLYRPHYPPAVIDLLVHECGLAPESVVADVGSGTGISSGLFLTAGNTVYGVEPNAEMRAAAESLLAAHLNFVSVPATAEATGLSDRMVDFVVAGQAFHWFDLDHARPEFARILRPGGWLVLMWNDRRIDSTPFLVEYENLLQMYATDYREVNHKNLDDAALAAFYGPAGCCKASFDNAQRFDFEGLKGRLLSSSYAPAAGTRNYKPMLADLRCIFNRHQEDGVVVFEYDTLVYYGRLA
jgi:SAM-dependent methyltransferase